MRAAHPVPPASAILRYPRHMANRWLPFLFPVPAVRSPRPRPSPGPLLVNVGGRQIAVAVRRNPRAKRYTLRLTAKGDGASLTIPKRGTLAEAKAFLDRHAGWLAEKMAAHQFASPVITGAIVPVQGIEHRLESTGSPRGRVRTTYDAAGHPVLSVPGTADHLKRRTEAHLRTLAKSELSAAVSRHAAVLGVRPTAVRIKDTTSRWGSASTTGTLSFSWRLAMAPPFVLDYLAAHEVAHLVEMNHSDRFWAICRRLAPRTEEARAWLKTHGRELHRVL
jgi:predicted metal-dependent hydrolase